ncbi:MarR family transcriptional regulator [Oerskovia sp. Sa1BUA8]|uniref:MarR family transcriptional regulator n=1 Tax=Oerskovia douganii TaxID=2762210 RepID=A0A9D5UD99_9CELL|nr:MarR family transcriptional regulator [Oerskovia douganii]MBE7701881.1 MarR family transcriptional regulator [Oerskovia douganii]
MTVQQDRFTIAAQGTPWLDDAQQLSWRQYLDGTARFVEALSRDHEEHSSLTLGEYELLVRLSEARDHTMRMSALADGLARSRSRVTHTVHRMEQRGLVRRTADADDRRGVNCVMTDAGHAELVASAPGHVTAVRRLMVDVLTPTQLQNLGEAMAAIGEACRLADERDQ